LIWDSIPRSTIQQSARVFLSHSSPGFIKGTPLLEKERDAGLGTLIADALRPLGLHAPRLPAAFPAYYYPMDISQIESERSQ
jgi:hypothetical protein